MRIRWYACPKCGNQELVVITGVTPQSELVAMNFVCRCGWSAIEKPSLTESIYFRRAIDGTLIER